MALIVIGALAPGWSQPHARYLIGAKTFAEQYIIAALIEQRLGAAGLSAARREGLGSSVVLDALAGNALDVYVDYTGTIWANDLHRNDARPRAEVTAGLGALAQGKARDHSARQPRLRERLCAGDVEEAR